MTDEAQPEVVESKRRRDAAGTRAALLAAARELFAERGFDRTTVRDIATRARANQALLYRYFGSKDDLFGVVMATQSRELLESTTPEQLVARVLERILDPHGPTAQDHPLYAALRSSGNDSAAAVLRRDLGEDYCRVLGSLTDAEDASVRADLVLAWLIGLGLVRSIISKEPLASADPEVVGGHVLRAVRTLLEKTDVRLSTE